MDKQTRKGEDNTTPKEVMPKAGEVNKTRSLRERLNEEQRRLEKIWRQDPARLWKSR